MLYQSLDLFIEKSKAGVYEWEAVASTTDKDNYDDSTSPDLFNKWMSRAAKTEKAETWLPEATGQPYLSVAHYPSMGGELSAGTTTWMGIEDGKFVARGTINDNVVGQAVIDNYSPDKPVKISAGWWDIEHRHGDFVFRRHSMNDVCPRCQAHENKQYTDGQLEHFALTTVPVNPYTDFALEEKSMKKVRTRKDDAAAIVGNDMAESIDAVYAAAVKRSEANAELDVLVVRSQAKTINGEDFEEGDFLVVEDASKPSTWHLPVKRMGKVDRHLMGAAKAALTVGFRGNKYQGAGKEGALKKLKALYESQKMVWKSEVEMEKVNVKDELVAKSDADPTETVATESPQAVAAEATTEEVVEKSEAEAEEVVAEAATEEEPDTELSSADSIDETGVVFRSVELGDQLDAVLKSGATRASQLAAIDEAVNAFALEMRSLAEVGTPVDPISELEAKITETQGNVATIAQSMATMLDRIEVIAQSVADATVQKSMADEQTLDAAEAEAPVQRSMAAAPVHPVTRMNPEGGKMSLRDIVNRSVGIQ